VRLIDEAGTCGHVDGIDFKSKLKATPRMGLSMSILINALMDIWSKHEVPIVNFASFAKQGS
jgi:hypothetical protein